MWRDRLATWAQRNNAFVDAKHAAGYTAELAEFLRKELLDMKLALLWQFGWNGLTW
jgi:hypothetical protein